MSYSPPEPPTPDSQPFDLDAFVAVVVALLGIGTVMAWGLTRPGFLQAEGTPPATTRRPSPADGGTAPIQRFRLRPDPPAATDAVPAPHPFSDRNRQTQDSPASLSPDTTAPAAPPQAAAPGDLLTGASAAAPIPLEPATDLLPAGDPLVFPDVPADYWAAPAIDALTARGLLSGLPEGLFAPELAITRAELAAQIRRGFELDSAAETVEFSDVPADHWGVVPIAVVVDTGFMRGYPEGEFLPDQPVPRVEVIAAIANGLGLTPPADPEASLSAYRDRDQIPEWAVDSIAAAAAAGIIINHPDPTQLAPTEPATRAEVAAIMAEALVYRGRMER